MMPGAGLPFTFALKPAALRIKLSARRRFG
jgi:hypothetical protein